MLTMHCLVLLVLSLHVYSSKTDEKAEQHAVRCISDELYGKILESDEITLKKGYTAEEKCIWRYQRSKNYKVETIVNDVTGKEEKRIVSANFQLLKIQNGEAM